MVLKWLQIVICVSIIISNYNCLGDSQFLNLSDYPGESCFKCEKGKNRVCYFNFTLELYHAMGPACGGCGQGVKADCYKPQCIIADGYQKGVMSINRMIPGPPINVCEGDLVVVDVNNQAHGTAATIHWHGLHMVKTPYMDGVPYATQCPIIFGTTFRYKFYAADAGTYFYHSHSGHHKLNGQFGSLVIRRPDDETPHRDKYDYDLAEHYILLADWKHIYGEDTFPGLPRGEKFPDSILINGRGTFVDKESFKHSDVPVTVYCVKPGSRYKFNLINSYSLTDTVQLQVEGHSMLITATDAYDVEPLSINTLVSNAGERYDFVINANQSSGDYWIRARGLSSENKQPTDSFALLRYTTNDTNCNEEPPKNQPPFPDYHDTYPIGKRLNHPLATCFKQDKEYCAADLTALENDKDLVTSEPDYKFVFSFYNEILSQDEVFWKNKNRYKRFDNPDGDTVADAVVNNISLIYPPKPVLTQYNEIDKSMFCEKSGCPEDCNGETSRECVHVVKVKTNSIVEMALHDHANVTDLDHPFHLHGYSFVVMGITNDTRNLKEAIAYAGKYRKDNPVVKDTVTVPMNGVVVARFRASNPGIWLMHCHYDHHLATGMGFLFQVGEPKEWVKTPKNFPKCGNYVPKIRKPTNKKTNKHYSKENSLQDLASEIEELI